MAALGRMGAKTITRHRSHSCSTSIHHFGTSTSHLRNWQHVNSCEILCLLLLAGLRSTGSGGKCYVSESVKWGSILKECCNTHQLPPLIPGGRVLVQDQHIKIWNWVGMAVDDRRNKQYLIQLDGSGRVSLRTREHLRSCHVLPSADEPDITGQEGSSAAQPPSPFQQSQVHAPARRQTRPPRWLEDYIV